MPENHKTCKAVFCQLARGGMMSCSPITGGVTLVQTSKGSRGQLLPAEFVLSVIARPTRRPCKKLYTVELVGKLKLPGPRHERTHPGTPRASHWRSYDLVLPQSGSNRCDRMKRVKYFLDELLYVLDQPSNLPLQWTTKYRQYIA